MLAHLELIIFGLLVAVTSFVLLASISRVPYPVFLVVGGLALSLVPGLPAIELPPDLVFLIFLPPLLYSAAFFSSPRDLKAQIRPIALLSIGLVLLTTVTVAVVGHVAIGLSWPVAFVLGVIVSPSVPDCRAISSRSSRARASSTTELRWPYIARPWRPSWLGVSRSSTRGWSSCLAGSAARRSA